MPFSKLREPKTKIIFSSIGLFFLFFWYLFSPYSGKKYFKIRQDITILNGEVTKLKKQNYAIEQEIKKLKTDKAYLEDIARKEYGMLKKNELLFEFKSSRTK